jgi:hypothetical protein
MTVKFPATRATHLGSVMLRNLRCDAEKNYVRRSTFVSFSFSFFLFPFQFGIILFQIPTDIESEFHILFP